MPHHLVEAGQRSVGQNVLQPLEKHLLRDSKRHEDVFAAATAERRPPQSERDYLVTFALAHSIPLVHPCSIAAVDQLWGSSDEIPAVT